VSVEAQDSSSEDLTERVGASVSGRTRRSGSEPNHYLICFPAKPILLERDRAYSLGRAEGNNIVLADADVSRNHAIISWDGESFVLKDLDSRNGCYVNRRPIDQPRPLQDDDRIKIGNRVFTFMVAEDRTVKERYFQRKVEKQEGETEVLDAEVGAPPQQGFAGSLADFGLPELIQTLELNRKTGVLTVVGDHGRGRIWVREGEPVAAELGADSGEEAVYTLLALSSGFFEFEIAETIDVATQIETNTKSLLMEAFRRQDEQKRAEDEAVDASAESALESV
jgi:hypothetical protein